MKADRERWSGAFPVAAGPGRPSRVAAKYLLPRATLRALGIRLKAASSAEGATESAFECTRV
jgi:hypothetical protein